MNRYTKVPVTIEAARWDGTVAGATPIIDWILDNGGTARYHDYHREHGEHIAVDTLEGTMRAGAGWWVIRGVAGEFYPCEHAIFGATYVPATDGWGRDREDRTLWYLPINPETDSDDGPIDGPLERTTTKANMVGSELLNGRHSPVLDLDFEARLVPSSTPGHYHLFLDGLELDPAAYEALLAALVAAKVIQPGFRRRFTESGTTLARIRRDKTPGEPRTGPIVVTTPGEAERF